MKFPSILLYWLLLLIPTIALGVFGWQLLREEERRLAEAAEAAQVERARIITENLTLFLEEARGGIIAGLSELPLADAHEAMEAWTRANPMVRQTFIWRPYTGVILPVAGPEENQSGFLKRHEPLLAPRARWETEARASRAPQRRLRAEGSLEEAVKAEVSFDADEVAPTPRQELKQMADDARVVANSRYQASFVRESPAGLELNEPAVGLPTASRDAAALEAERPRVLASGWIPSLEQKPLTAIAWIEFHPGGEIRGAEVDLELIVSRMLAVLPRGEENSDHYTLIDHAGRVYPSKDVMRASAPVHLEIGTLLPGWQLAVDSVVASSNPGRGFFLLSSLLLGVLLASILSGGSLLLYQAHRHQVDARQKSSFVSNVSHELKTPLTTIRMYAELIGEGRVREPEKQRNYLNVIITESQRLTRLINNVLDFSRLEQDQGKQNAERINLKARLNEILDAQEIRLQAAGIRLHRHFPAGELAAPVEPDALEQAVLNLLDNAIKYAADGGELRLEAERVGDRACIHVSDKGPGIQSDQERRLFEKFYRGDTSLTAKQAGCGLGLNIARRLLRRNGGDLVYSPREGGGARFTIELPLSSSGSTINTAQT